MSEQEYWEGTLKRIPFPKGYTTFAKQAGYLLSEGYTLSDLDIEDEYIYLRNSNVAYLKGKWFYLEKKPFDIHDISDIEEVSKNVFRFRVGFYNGGTCLQEELEDLIEEK